MVCRQVWAAFEQRMQCDRGASRQQRTRSRPGRTKLADHASNCGANPMFLQKLQTFDKDNIPVDASLASSLALTTLISDPNVALQGLQSVRAMQA